MLAQGLDTKQTEYAHRMQYLENKGPREHVWKQGSPWACLKTRVPVSMSENKGPREHVWKQGSPWACLKTRVPVSMSSLQDCIYSAAWKFVNPLLNLWKCE